ncbi:M23 family metallopeptidase [Haloferula chungangensis]|uniref:M23 family metallopeptidase n=1 Tax=Haloferula chungangensis TaxID=1048331 RepID=A0ABW2L893_9BACT
MKIFSATTFILILIGALMLAGVLWRESAHKLGPIENLNSMQGADAPLFLPKDGEPRHRLHQFNAWQLATIPHAHRFDAPMGTENGGLTFNAQKFWKMNDEQGGHHTGDDLDGLGGMDSDLGDPVFAAADGLVVYSGEPSPGWGKVLILAHRSADRRWLQSMYAGLLRIDVPMGKLVGRGQRIGLVGTANGDDPAHLHFELRESRGVEIGSAYSMFAMNRLDPEETLAELRGAPADRLSSSLLPIALDKKGMWNTLEIEGAEKLGELQE